MACSPIVLLGWDRNADARRYGAMSDRPVPQRCHYLAGATGRRTHTLGTGTAVNDVDDAHADRIDDNNITLDRGVFENAVRVAAERWCVGQIAQCERWWNYRSDGGGKFAGIGLNVSTACGVIESAPLDWRECRGLYDGLNDSPVRPYGFYGTGRLGARCRSAKKNGDYRQRYGNAWVSHGIAPRRANARASG